MLLRPRWSGLLVCSSRSRMSAGRPGARAAAAHQQPAGAGGGSLPRESVWDYPRPPALLPVPQWLRVLLEGQVVADTTAGMRVCETASPPTYYFPYDSVDWALLRRSAGGTTFCEWKGTACYWDVLPQGGQPREALQRVAWSYEAPTPAFSVIAGWLAFYARPPLECWVGEERVQPQEGKFYGGWVTPNIVGPFKGGPGTAGW